jgi:molybdopterin molybdotransferase
MHDQTRGLQRITQFTPLADALARTAARVRPVAAKKLEPAAALGHILAEDISLKPRLPAAAIALRDGWAVQSELTTDASPYAPAPIPAATWVEVGGEVGPGDDAVLPLEGVTTRTKPVAAVTPIFPGDGILPAGGDVPVGARILHCGCRINRLHVALLQVSGVESIPLRAPRLRLARARPDPDWIVDTIVACIAGAVHSVGGVATNPNSEGDFEHAFADTTSDAVVVIGGSGCGQRDRVVRALASTGDLVVHGIGLIPGETAAFGMIGARPVLVLPGRLDAALAAWHMLGRAMLQKLTGCTEALPTVRAKLTQKLSSPGGLAELVPVHCDGCTATPLAGAYLPVAVLAQANGWIFIEPESEGYAAGSDVAIRPWP